MPIEKDVVVGATKKITLPLLNDKQIYTIQNMVTEPETFSQKELGNMVCALAYTLHQAEEFLELQGRVARASLNIVRKRWNSVPK